MIDVRTGIPEELVLEPDRRDAFLKLSALAILHEPSRPGIDLHTTTSWFGNRRKSQLNVPSS